MKTYEDTIIKMSERAFKIHLKKLTARGELAQLKKDRKILSAHFNSLRKEVQINE